MSGPRQRNTDPPSEPRITNVPPGPTYPRPRESGAYAAFRAAIMACSTPSSEAKNGESAEKSVAIKSIQWLQKMAHEAATEENFKRWWKTQSPTELYSIIFRHFKKGLPFIYKFQKYHLEEATSEGLFRVPRAPIVLAKPVGSDVSEQVSLYHVLLELNVENL